MDILIFMRTVIAEPAENILMRMVTADIPTKTATAELAMSIIPATIGRRRRNLLRVVYGLLFI